MFFSSMSFHFWTKLEALFSLLNRWRLAGQKGTNELEPGLDVRVELREGCSHSRIHERVQTARRARSMCVRRFPRLSSSCSASARRPRRPPRQRRRPLSRSFRVSSDAIAREKSSLAKCPQRKRKALEGAYLEARRELRDLACTCKTCDRPFVFTVAEQEFFAAQGWPIPRPRCKACSTSKKSGTKRAADPSAQHHRTDAPPKKPRLDAPPEKPPAGTSGGAGKAEATRSAKGGDGKGATKAGAGAKGVGRGNSPGDSQSTASVVTKQAAPMMKQAAPMTKQGEPTTSVCFLCGQMGHVAKACTVKSASTQELSAALKAARARENAQLLAARAQNPERNQPDDVADAEHVKNKKPVGFHRGRKEGKKGRA